MNVQTFNISHKKIYSFDNFLSYQLMQSIYSSAVSSNFVIQGHDNKTIENRNSPSLISVLKKEDLLNSQLNVLINSIGNHLNLSSFEIRRPIINLIRPCDFSNIHVDVERDNSENRFWSLLYYINLNWQFEWGGDTLFFDDEITSVKFYSTFNPGKIILFDSSIPHILRPPTSNAPSYRFTFSCVLYEQ